MDALPRQMEIFALSDSVDIGLWKSAGVTAAAARAHVATPGNPGSHGSRRSPGCRIAGRDCPNYWPPSL